MNDPFASIIITGGRGMLARAVQGELERRGRAFVACDRGTCDVTDRAVVDGLFERHKPTLLINCAAYTRVDRCEREPELADAVNGRAVAHLAEAARRHRTRLVHISTDFVFDGAQRTPYRPADPPRPLSTYGRSKLLGEQLLRGIDPPHWLIVRTAWLYGPGGHCFPRSILSAARAGEPLKIVADQTGTPTCTLDLAETVVDLVERSAAGIFHATNAGQATRHEFAKAVLDAFAVRAELSAITAAEWKAMHPRSAVRPPYSVLDRTDTERLIGRPIRHWRDALAAYQPLLAADWGASDSPGNSGRPR